MAKNWIGWNAITCCCYESHSTDGRTIAILHTEHLHSRLGMKEGQRISSWRKMRTVGLCSDAPSVDWVYEEKSRIAIQRDTELKASIGSKAGPKLFHAADCGKSSCSLLPPWPDQCDFASASRPQWIAAGVVNIPTKWSKCKVFRSKCALIQLDSA